MAATAAARVERWRQHDFYDVLGLSQEATPEEIRRGFRKIALTCHPDKVRESEKEAATKRFQLIAEAYEVLSKPESRQEYDEVRGSGAKESPPAGRGGTSQPATTRWQSCKGCFGRFSQKDLRKCSPHCSQPVCFSCDSCSNCNKTSETHDSKEYSYIRAGMTLITVYDACVFPTPNSWKVMTKLKEGTTVICVGSPKVCDGDVMVPIEPRGWVDLVDLKLPRKHAPAREHPEAKGASKAAPAQSTGPAEGSKMKASAAPRPEVWTKEKQEAPAAVPEFVRQASRLAMDVGDTAKEYVKSGYNGSAMVAGEALRMAQAAGEHAPWIAGEAVRMASEAAGKVWDAAATAFQRLPSEESEAPGAADDSDQRSKVRILTMMGFEQEAATASLKRCSTIEAAVEYMMETSTLPSTPAQHKILPLQAVGQTFGPGSTSIAKSAPGVEMEPVQRRPSVRAALLNCGFSEDQAMAAARRCSSVEAAVEWIAAHPDVKE